MLDSPSAAAAAPQQLLSTACAHMLAGRVGAAFGALCKAAAGDEPQASALQLLAALIDQDAHQAEGLEVDLDTLSIAVARVLEEPALASGSAGRLAQRLIRSEFEAMARASQAMSLDALPHRCHRLLIALLRKELVTDLELEGVLRALRNALLKRFAPMGGPSGYTICPDSLRYIEALALHSFRNEHVWAETPEESEQVAHLQSHMEHHLSSGARPHDGLLALLAAYRPLHRNDVVRARYKLLAESKIAPTFKRILVDPMQEEEISTRISVLTPLSEAGASQAVRAQYEANPYPRWAQIPNPKPRPYGEVVLEEIAPNAIPLQTVEAPSVLVAGCGSGRSTLMYARRFQRASVLGVDLSRASLAYAWRQSIALQAPNVAFAQADILTLDRLAERFDVIDAVGVLHHMAEPEAGLARLTPLLAPNGLMQLGFYSARARGELAALRAVIRAEGLKPDIAGLRALRLHYAARLRQVAPTIADSEDFYSASGLRDLAFHVCEHEYALPQIGEILARADLEFLGFVGLPAAARQTYATFAPSDATQTDLASWDAFEAAHPETFQGLYRFWCRRR